jgi:hypothetical protein
MTECKTYIYYFYEFIMLPKNGNVSNQGVRDLLLGTREQGCRMGDFGVANHVID